MTRPTGTPVVEFVDVAIDDVAVTGGDTALVNLGTEHWQRALELSRLVF
jgi:hypothetical protein